MREEWNCAVAEAHQGTEGSIGGKGGAGIQTDDLVELALSIALIGSTLEGLRSCGSESFIEGDTQKISELDFGI